MKGSIPDEQPQDTYFHVMGDETWLVSASDGDGVVRKRRVALRPADDFFVVRRAFGYDYRNIRGTEDVYPFDHSDVYLVQGSIAGPLWWVASPRVLVRSSAIFSVLALLTGVGCAVVRPSAQSLAVAATATVLWLAIGYLHVVLLSP